MADMKCKFEHDGDCCNSGATQYMCKCKKPCYEIIPMTNGDRIRAMSDEKLAKEVIEYRDDWSDYVTHNGIFDEWEDALKAEIELLQQPAEVE